MTRMSVAVEGQEPLPDGRILQRGALYLPDDKFVIVNLNGDFMRPIGTAREIQRDLESGSVTMDIRLHPKWSHIDLDDCIGWTGWDREMITSSKDGKTIYIIAATVKVVALEWGGETRVPATSTAPGTEGPSSL